MKTSTWFKNGKINGVTVDIEVCNGKIHSIGKTECDGIDLHGADVFPGLIDIHCHGAMGYDALGDTEHLEIMSIYFAKNGITTWYPTTGGTKEEILRMLNTPLEGMRGANMPGYHLEGPYLSPNKLGACAPDSVKLPELSDFEAYDYVKLITMAPELTGAIEYIKNTKAKVAIGHTTANYDTAIEAIEAGADCLTHTFNAMPPFHHREPGVIGAAINKNIYVQVICDGVHLHRSVVTALYRIFGKERMILISDAVAGTGLGNGIYYKQGKYKRIIKDGVIRNENGNLAGSASNLYMGVIKAIEFGIPREDAFYMASATPASYMGLNKGRMDIGYDADFIAVDENDEIIGTIALYKHNNENVELKKLYVRSDYRGKGLSKELYSKALEICKMNAFKRIFLGTYDKLETAINFYLKRRIQRNRRIKRRQWS